MPIGRRAATPAPEPAPAPRQAAPVRKPEPEVDKYADKPYVSPSIAAALRGEKVNFGTDVVSEDAPTSD